MTFPSYALGWLAEEIQPKQEHFDMRFHIKIDPQRKWMIFATFFLCVGVASLLIYPVIRIVTIRPIATPFAPEEYAWVGICLALIAFGAFSLWKHFRKEPD